MTDGGFGGKKLGGIIDFWRETGLKWRCNRYNRYRLSLFGGGRSIKCARMGDFSGQKFAFFMIFDAF